MATSDRHFCCPVCGNQTETAPADAAERRSHSLLDKLYTYRVCPSCSLLFRVSLLDKALKHFSSSNQTSSLAVPTSDGGPNYNEEWSIEEVDRHSNIRPAPSDKEEGNKEQPRPVAKVASPLAESVEMNSGVGIQLQINQSRVKVQFDLPVGKSGTNSEVQQSIQMAISTLGQAISALGNIQQSQAVATPAKEATETVDAAATSKE